jgi:hypothetical protein
MKNQESPKRSRSHSHVFGIEKLKSNFMRPRCGRHIHAEV